MNDNSVVVSIVGEASGVTPAVQATKGEFASIEPILAELNASMVKLTAQMKESMEAGANVGRKIKEGMNEAKAATEGENSALTTMIMKVHEGAESVRTFQMRAKEFAEVYVAMFAVEGVRRWAESMGEAAEKLRNLSTELGITVPELQQLQGVADQTGVPMDTISKAVGLMDKNLFNSAGKTTLQANAFKSLGISATDGRTNMEKLAVVADKFKNMDEGPKRAALAFAIFGRSGLAMIPVLEKGRDGLEELNKKTKEYGAVSDDAQAKSLALAESTNESKLAFTGFSNVMASAFAPLLKSATDSLNSMIKSFVQSYREGGTAKVLMEALAGVVRILGVAFEIVGAILKPFGEAIKFIADNIEIIGPLAAAFGAVMVASFAASMVTASIETGVLGSALVALRGEMILSEVGPFTAALSLFTGGVQAAAAATWEWTTALLANPLTWVAVAIAAVTAGLVWLAMHTRTVSDAFVVMKDVCLMALEWIKSSVMALGGMLVTMGKIAYDAFTLQWGSIQSDWQAGLDGLASKVQAFDNKIKALHDDMMAHLAFGGGGAAAPKPPAMPKMPGSFDPTLGSTPKAKKEKGAKDDLVQKLNEELEAKKTAWEMEQEAQGTFQKFSLQTEADFWAQALKRHNLSAKDRLEIERKYLTAAQALKREEISAKLDGFKQEMEAVGANADKKLKIAQDEQRYIVRMYGATSAEARKIADEIVKIEREKAAQLTELRKEEAKEAQELALSGVAAEQATADFEVAIGRKSAADRLKDEARFENEIYAIKLKALKDQLALEALDPKATPAQLAKVHAAIESLEQAHQAKLTKITREATLERTKLERQGIDSVSKSFGDHISKMITLQEGWKQGFIGIYQSLVGAVASAISQIIAKHVAMFLTKLILGKQEAAQNTANYIGQAGAGGVASMAAAPFPLNLTAPAFGASMAAAAGAFGAISSAEGGDWHVQEGLYKLHANEMVLPAWAAGPLRQMVGGGGSGGPGTFGGSKSSTTESSSKTESTFHYSPTIHHNAMDLKEAVKRDSRDMRKWFMNQMRNGALTPAMT